MKTMLETRARKLYGIVTNDYLNHLEEFRWFFHSNFENRTELDLIELYSECYNIGNKNINFDVCYLVMQDTGFLIDDLKLMYLNQRYEQPTAGESVLNKMCFEGLRKVIDKEIRLTAKIKFYADNLGVESISHRFYKLHLIIESKIIYFLTY